MKKRFLGFLCISILLFLSQSSQGAQIQYQEEPKKLDVPYVPTPQKVVEGMLRLAEVGKNDLVYDLGCGDGRIVIAAAQKFGAHAIGIDIDPDRIKEAKENAAQAGVKDLVQFIQDDLFSADIHRATVVTLYLLTSVNLKLRPKLLHVLKPGTRIVSHDFSMEEWQPDKSTVVVDNEDSHKVFFWVVPANVTGSWEWTMPSGLGAGVGKKNYMLQMDQLFQWINGTVTADGIQMLLMDAKLNGDKLQFSIEEETKGQRVILFFEGRVNGNLIEGTVTAQTGAQGGAKAVNRSWKARRNPSTVKLLDIPK